MIKLVLVWIPLRSTHHQYTSPAVHVKDTLTTLCDFIHFKLPAVTSQRTPLHPNSVLKAQLMGHAAQHFSDINIIHLRIDGVGHEGPDYEGVQYYWTLWHLKQEKI